MYLGVGIRADLLDVVVSVILATFFTLALALARAARRLRSLELGVLLLVRRLGLFDLIVGISANPLELGFFFLEGGLGSLNLLVSVGSDLFDIRIPGGRLGEFSLERLLVLLHRLDQFVRNLQLDLFLVQLGLELFYGGLYTGRERGIRLLRVLLLLRRGQLLLHLSVRRLRPLNLGVSVRAKPLSLLVRRRHLRARGLQLVLQLLGLVRLRVGGVERGGCHGAALRLLPLQRRPRRRRLRLERLDALVQRLRLGSLRLGSLRVRLFSGDELGILGLELGS